MLARMLEEIYDSIQGCLNEDTQEAMYHIIAELYQLEDDVFWLQKFYCKSRAENNGNISCKNCVNCAYCDMKNEACEKAFCSHFLHNDDC